MNGADESRGRIAVDETEPSSVPSLAGEAADESRPVGLDRRRYARVVMFLCRVLLHILWWDVLLRKVLPFGLAARSADSRWRSLAARYRRLAIDLGGLLIKLGQFLSTRVDVLPRGVIDELSGLQDEVPPLPFEEIRDAIETSFGAPLDAVFSSVDEQPVGSASLAQVHRARLLDGTSVVVKVQRPGIEVLVETDLAAFRLGAHVLGGIGWVRRRADMDKLYAEFARTSRVELDFGAEGLHAETFAEQFADDQRVKVPKVYWHQSTTRVLTLEDVTGLKINDKRALLKADIDPAEVAHVLIDMYLQQIFVHNFVHVDPHPGNLFVLERGARGRAGDPAFRIAFVDFGMVAVVPERVRSLLREFIIGVATRDAGRIVRAYYLSGVLLPGADLDRIEQATAAVLDRFWGVRMGDVQEMAMREAGAMMSEFSDLLREMPFQLPSDLLFIGRAVGILSGLATELDPELDIWEELAPFARQLAAGDGQVPTWAARLGPLEEPIESLVLLASALEDPMRSLVALPTALERVLSDASTGQLTVRYDLSVRARQDARHLTHAVRSVTWAILCAGLLVAGAILYVSQGPSTIVTVMFGGAGLALIMAVVRR